MRRQRKYYYYSVRFDTEQTFWYRSPKAYFRPGEKVIVPVFNSGEWEIGTVTEKRKCLADAVPYPVEKTKGIVQSAGWFGTGKVRRHNKRIRSGKYVVCDLSVAWVRTAYGTVRYITCQKERDLNRYWGRRTVFVETYPPVRRKEIPIEAQDRLWEREQRMAEEIRAWDAEKRRKQLEDMKMDEFLMDMEDLEK